MPIKQNREYRNLQILQPQSQQKRIESDFYVEGLATTFDKPYLLYVFDDVEYFEIIDRHALDNADISDVIMQYDHQGRVRARTTNNTLIAEPNNVGFFICADLSKSNASKELYGDIEAGLITRMSWAFTIDQDEYNRDTRTRTIKKVKKVYDVSAVSIPASFDTEISARSYFDGVIEIEKQELLERKKKSQVLKYKIMIGEKYEINRN